MERYQQPWAEKLVQLLLEIKQTVEMAQDAGHMVLAAQQIADFERRYHTLIEQGYQANPPPVRETDGPKQRGKPKQSPARNLLDRLHKHQRAVLAFMYDFKVPFDNNLAAARLARGQVEAKSVGLFSHGDRRADFLCHSQLHLNSPQKRPARSGCPRHGPRRQPVFAFMRSRP